MVRPMSDERVGGIARYAKERGWSLMIQDRLGYGPTAWRGDGAIATIRDDPALLAVIRRMVRSGVPVVDLTANRPDVRVARVTSDHAGIGRLAAEHFAERNYRHLAWFSLGWGNVHRLRFDGFARGAVAASAGGATGACGAEEVRRWVFSEGRGGRSPGGWNAFSSWVSRKLRAAPKPLGVLAYDEADAARILHAAEALGLAVPEEVAVLSIGNNRLVCENQSVPLSSIDQNLARGGYEAAAMLDRLMDGAPVPERPVLVPPAGVVLRRSTDAVAAADPLVRAALGFIAGRLRTRFGVEQVVRALGTTPDRLHRRFAAELGHGVGAEISRQRLALAKRLLREPSLTASAIAAACGYCTPSHLSNAFRAATGSTPGAWRTEPKPLTPRGAVWYRRNQR